MFINIDKITHLMVICTIIYMLVCIYWSIRAVENSIQEIKNEQKFLRSYMQSIENEFFKKHNY